MFVRKTKSLNYNGLVASAKALGSDKKGGPKNESISGIVYENKGGKETALGKSWNVIENKLVIGIFDIS